MENQRDAHLKSINPFLKFVARERTNISDHHLLEMKNLACGGEKWDILYQNILFFSFSLLIF